MIGRIIYRQEKGRDRPCRENLFGLPVLNLFLYDPPGLSVKKLEKTLGRLEMAFRREGVSRVILPEPFPHTQRLHRLKPISTVSFYRAVADVLALKLLEKKGVPPGQSRVALTASRPGPELFQAACCLCRSVREVKIEVPGEEGERLARELQQRFGVPVVPPGALADVTLSFGDREGDLWLCEDEPSLSGLCLKAEGIEPPAEIEQQVLALLWERGRLKREDLRVTDMF